MYKSFILYLAISPSTKLNIFSLNIQKRKEIPKTIFNNIFKF